jgi:hypothetical protein
VAERQARTEEEPQMQHHIHRWLGRHWSQEKVSEAIHSIRFRHDKGITAFLGILSALLTLLVIFRSSRMEKH